MLPGRSAMMVLCGVLVCAGARAQAQDAAPAVRLVVPGAPSGADAVPPPRDGIPGWVMALSAGGAIAGGGVLAWLGLRGARAGGGKGGARAGAGARTEARSRTRFASRDASEHADGLTQTMQTAIARRGTLGAANPAEVAAFRAMARVMGVHRAEQVRLLAQARTLGLPTALGLLLVEPVRERR